MSDPIEEMKKAGWEEFHLEGIKDTVYRYEYKKFRRLLPKPNAVVDWNMVEGFDYWTDSLFKPLPCGAEIPKDLVDAVRNLRQAIKKAE